MSKDQQQSSRTKQEAARRREERNKTVVGVNQEVFEKEAFRRLGNSPGWRGQ